MSDYKLLKIIGEGSSAVSYLGEGNDGQKVLIKRYKTAFYKDGNHFTREVDVLRSLSHAKIPTYIDSYMEKVEGRTLPHIVQEYVDGVTLQEYLEINKPKREEIFDWIDQILRILSYLHALQPPVIHRDIKLSNILIQDGHLFLIDFGLAIDDQVRTLGHSIGVGTLGYQAPEQISGNPTIQSDLYSVGVCAVAMLTDLKPHSLLDGMKLRWEEKCIHLPTSVQRWLDKLLAVEPAQRFEHAQAALKDFPTNIGTDQPDVITHAVRVPTDVQISEDVLDLFQAKEKEKKEEDEKKRKKELARKRKIEAQKEQEERERIERERLRREREREAAEIEQRELAIILQLKEDKAVLIQEMEQVWELGISKIGGETLKPEDLIDIMKQQFSPREQLEREGRSHTVFHPLMLMSTCYHAGAVDLCSLNYAQWIIEKGYPVELYWCSFYSKYLWEQLKERDAKEGILQRNWNRLQDLFHPSLEGLVHRTHIQRLNLSDLMDVLEDKRHHFQEGSIQSGFVAQHIEWFSILCYGNKEDIETIYKKSHAINNKSTKKRLQIGNQTFATLLDEPQKYFPSIDFDENTEEFWKNISKICLYCWEFVGLSADSVSERNVHYMDKITSYWPAEYRTLLYKNRPVETSGPIDHIHYLPKISMENIVSILHDNFREIQRSPDLQEAFWSLFNRVPISPHTNVYRYMLNGDCISLGSLFFQHEKGTSFFSLMFNKFSSQLFAITPNHLIEKMFQHWDCLKESKAEDKRQQLGETIFTVLFFAHVFNPKVHKIEFAPQHIVYLNEARNGQYRKKIYTKKLDEILKVVAKEIPQLKMLYSSDCFRSVKMDKYWSPVYRGTRLALCFLTSELKDLPDDFYRGWEHRYASKRDGHFSLSSHHSWFRVTHRFVNTITKKEKDVLMRDPQFKKHLAHRLEELLRTQKQGRGKKVHVDKTELENKFGYGQSGATLIKYWKQLDSYGGSNFGTFSPSIKRKLAYVVSSFSVVSIWGGIGLICMFINDNYASMYELSSMNVFLIGAFISVFVLVLYIWWLIPWIKYTTLTGFRVNIYHERAPKTSKDILLPAHVYDTLNILLDSDGDQS